MITLTCKMGTFHFEDTVILSKAKLIRDSVMGQYFNPRPRTTILRTAKDVEEYVRNELSDDLGRIPFEVQVAGVRLFNRAERAEYEAA